MSGIEIIADFGVLLCLAKKEADLRNSPDKVAYEKAKKEHEEYRDICLRADRMTV